MTPHTRETFLRLVTTPRRRDHPRRAELLRDTGMQRIPTPHGTVAAWRIGAGSATLLVHGWEDDNSLWTEMIRTLVERDHAVVVFDLPAHGFSEGDSGLGFEAADATRAVAAALGPIGAVVGHSMGASAAALAVRDGLNVECCVLIAPPLRGGDRWRRVAKRTGVAADVADGAHLLYDIRVGTHRAAFDLRDELTNLETKVLLVHSTADEHMPVADSQAAGRRSPVVELMLVEGHGHRETARAPAVTGRIVDFIEAAAACPTARKDS